jgi:hypothetical protein
MFWKHCSSSDCCRFGDYLASIPTPSLLAHPAAPALIQSQHNLSYTLNCLKAARLALDACQAQSTALRTAHLEDRPLQASRDSDTSAEIALNNILKAEEVRQTFHKLRKHAKGVHYCTLQRVEVPLLSKGLPKSQTTSLSDPTALFDAIFDQNTKHFSQVTPSPGASGGKLSLFIPPFECNAQTDSILLGDFYTSEIDPLDEVGLFLRTMSIPDSLRGNDPIDISISMDYFQQSFRKSPEIKAPSPSGHHLTHYKVLAHDDRISTLLAFMISLPFRLGFAPLRWTTAIQIC